MHDDPSGAPQQRRPRKRFSFWSEVLVVCAAVGFCAALLIRDYAAVRSRRELLQHLEGHVHFRCVRRDDPSFPISDRVPDVSWFRRTLGDEAIALILLPPESATDEEVVRARSIFPEAKVARFPIR